MTDEELAYAFERIETAMKTAGLEWAVGQVQDEIQFGRRSTKRITATTDASSALMVFSNEGRKRRQTVSFAATRPLTARERLEVLVGAIEQVVVATYEMEQTIRDRVARIANRTVTIRLVHEGEDGDGIVIAESSEVRARHVKRLEHLLAELRRVI